MALAHAILSLLIERPRSGYDLMKQFDGSVGFFWRATHQQIYRELARLEAEGWLTAETISQTSKPDKKLFRVTELGRSHLVAWMQTPTEPLTMKDDLLVKLFAGHLVETPVLIKELERHRVLHQHRLADYQTIETQFFQQPEHLPLEYQCRYLTLRRGIRYELDWLDWCDEAIHMLGHPASTLHTSGLQTTTDRIYR